VKLALQGAGLRRRRSRQRVHRRQRERRPLPGMLLHLDGSDHRWFQDERRHDLLVILDDATSEIYYAQLVESESTPTVMAALRSVIAERGIFCALYSDRASHFFVTESGRAGGSHAGDASGTGVASSGDKHDPRLLAAGAGTLGAQLPHFLQIEPQAWRTSLASSEVVVGAARGQHFDPALRSTLRGSV